MMYKDSAVGKLISIEDLARLRELHPGKRIVHCHGVFDLFHHGHLLHFKSAKHFGDILVVTVTSDQYVNKGPGRPRFPQANRAAMLAALEFVDYVAINDHPTGTAVIRALRPHYYVKGPDYSHKEDDITGGILEEENAVRAVGGQLVFTDDPTESATELINTYFHSWDKQQKKTIDLVKETLSLDDIMRIIDSLAGLRVIVIGEPIVDTYIFCNPVGLSTKSPTISAQFLSQEDYAGGSLAIANHLAALGCKVTLLMTHGGEDYFQKLLKNSVNPSISIEACITPDIPTPRKTRYLLPFRAQRVFELINLRADQWRLIDPSPFCKKIKHLARSHDVCIVADFGHGLFEGVVLESLQDIKTFIAANVQTNSGNFGFNPFTKHRRYDYMSIDERECRLATHDRLTPIVDLARRTVKEKIEKPVSITLGWDGSLYFDQKGREYSCPTFFKEVVDTTGAGDAFFTLTSLLVKLGVLGPVIPFLGNCYAGLQTRVIGNKLPVSKVDFIRTVRSILQDEKTSSPKPLYESKKNRSLRGKARHRIPQEKIS